MEDTPGGYSRRNSLRLSEFDYSARRIYFVTLITFERQRVFRNRQLAKSVCDCLKDLRKALGFDLHCYCLMPDHLHLLVGLGKSGKTLGEVCGSFKSLSTRVYWRWHQGRLWQRQFFDHIIRNEVEYWDTVEYIRLNPVRKSLVTDWRQWPYTGTLDS
jgi:REP element-mobilizing transposase RayT